MSWVGWRCTRCDHEMRITPERPAGPRSCPRCSYTVYEPIHDHERPDWAATPADQEGGGAVRDHG